jgi:hypothetical protein
LSSEKGKRIVTGQSARPAGSAPPVDKSPIKNIPFWNLDGDDCSKWKKLLP